MFDEFNTELITERLIRRIEQANTYFLMKIGASIKQIKNLTPSQAQQLIQMLKYGGNIEEIIKKIAQYTDMNIADIDDIFYNYAKKDQYFFEKFYNYRNIPFVPFNENEALKMQTMALSNIAKNEMYNATRSNVLGYTIYDVLPNGKKGKAKFYGLRDTYNKVLDEALLNVGQGKETFDSAMKRILQDVGESGLKTLNYESGRVVSLESAATMHLKGKLRELHNENQKIIGEEIGTDGIEISVHSNPAPDHELAQGRQFSNEEFDKLQSGQEATDYKGIKVNLDHDHKNGYRPISEMNCYHYIFAIILGVSEPNYTDEQLKKIIDDNNKGFEYKGKHYTNYQGEQMQRRLENEIRKQKDVNILAKSSDNTELVNQSQYKINVLTQRYKEFSNVSGLGTKMDRLRVSGYRKNKVELLKLDNKIIAPLEKYQDIINKKAYNENTYKNMLNDYDKWYNTLDKKEIEKVLSDYDEYIQKTNSLNINTIGVKESNPLGEFINKKLGYDSKPELINQADFWIDEDGESTYIGDTTLLDKNHWFRGIDGEKSQQYIQEFKTGKFFAGEGYDANGTYVTNSYSEALSYTGNNEENIIYMIPKQNAKIVKYNQISNLNYKISSQIDYNKYMNEEGELYINFTDKILNDNGYLSSLLGYDIIDFEPIDARKVILNRGSIKVVK